jgi:type IV secretory pathway VirB10-like protein
MSRRKERAKKAAKYGIPIVGLIAGFKKIRKNKQEKKAANQSKIDAIVENASQKSKASQLNEEAPEGLPKEQVAIKGEAPSAKEQDSDSQPETFLGMPKTIGIGVTAVGGIAILGLVGYLIFKKDN